jgi:hypothetical protein
MAEEMELNSQGQKGGDSSGTAELRWLAGLGTAGIIVDAVALVIRVWVPAFPWHTAVNFAAGMITLVFLMWGFLHMVRNSDRTLSDVEVTRGPIEEIYQIVRQNAVVQSLKPHDAEDFRLAFESADKIRAYNPPLTLLGELTDNKFREVIFKLLVQNNALYQAIVGEEGSVQLLKLWDHWVTDHGPRAANNAGCKMHITVYKHTQQLHTPVNQWPCLNQDLRGLSFFLIDAQNSRKSLLYILGEPFTPDFDVPKIGLLITEPEDNCPIYRMIGDTFDYRWQMLISKGKPPLVVAEQRLPDFCKTQQSGRTAHNGAAQTRPLAPETGDA